jgi:hypothetical protein
MPVIWHDGTLTAQIDSTDWISNKATARPFLFVLSHHWISKARKGCSPKTKPVLSLALRQTLLARYLLDR